ncbi:MAG: hypothetical protein JJU27_19590 [Gammaproteobacteria bacterium]|nr:hypothetical protein [Gammaproteobacteria bacterium]
MSSLADDSSTTPVAPPVVPKGLRPAYLGDVHLDQLLGIAMAVATEVSVMHDRLDTVARLAGTGKPFTMADIDAYIPDDTVASERAKWRKAYLQRLLRVMHETFSPEAKQAELKKYAEFVDLLGRAD